MMVIRSERVHGVWRERKGDERCLLRSIGCLLQICKCRNDDEQLQRGREATDECCSVDVARRWSRNRLELWRSSSSTQIGRGNFGRRYDDDVRAMNGWSIERSGVGVAIEGQPGNGRDAVTNKA